MTTVDGWDLSSTENLQSQEFSLGGKTWRIKKLLPMEAKRLFIRHVLPCFASVKDMNLGGLSPEGMAIKLFSSADPVHLEAMSQVFMQHCLYCQNDAGQFVGVMTDYEEFTKDVLPVDLIMLDIRAFAVNFGESASKVVGELEKRMAADNQINQWPQTPSSTPESTPDTSHSPT